MSVSEYFFYTLNWLFFSLTAFYQWVQVSVTMCLCAVTVYVPCLSVALARVPEPLCCGSSAHEPPGSHGLQLQSAAGPKSWLANPLQWGCSPFSSRNGPTQPWQRAAARPHQKWYDLHQAPSQSTELLKCDVASQAHLCCRAGLQFLLL